MEMTTHARNRTRERGISYSEIIRAMTSENTVVTVRGDALRYECGNIIVVADKENDEIITVMRPLKGRGRRKGKKR